MSLNPILRQGVDISGYDQIPTLASREEQMLGKLKEEGSPMVPIVAEVHNGLVMAGLLNHLREFPTEQIPPEVDTWLGKKKLELTLSRVVTSRTNESWFFVRALCEMLKANNLFKEEEIFNAFCCNSADFTDITDVHIYFVRNVTDGHRLVVAAYRKLWDMTNDVVLIQQGLDENQEPGIGISCLELN